MRLVNRILRLSATDLANHLGCAHLSQQNRAVAEGRARKPKWHDPIAAILQQRGIEHEAAYLAHLRDTEGLDVLAISSDEPESMGLEKTIEAMRKGLALIYQAPLGNAHWYGRADFLRRLDAPSGLGAWSYEVIDAKLATETRAGTILQLCVYSELVADIQGTWPERAHVVAPHHGFHPEPHRLADYAAYYRLVKRRLEEAIAKENATTYPEPVMHCEVCAWWRPCNARRREDDHLCFVAGVSRVQIKELRRIEVNSLERLGELRDIPKPKRGSRDALTRVRDQAAIQLKARRLESPQYEILGPVDGLHGLAMLPAPSSHDIFLDLEGDRLAVDGGRDYLFGYVGAGGDYVPVWAMNPAEEKAAFEQLIDLILAAFREHPDLHVYHFGAYEPTAFKRLSGRYATRETELDTILRAELFVDLHTIVRHALRASVESYSIKELEQFYGFERGQDLREATASRRAIEWAIEMKENVRGAADLAPHIAAVERYNREDCVSAEKLRGWLERLRAEQVQRGIELPRPPLQTGEASEKIEEITEETHKVMARLLEGVPVDPDQRSEEQQARWLTAHLLEWHRREDKAAWWEYFRLRDLPLDEYEEERSALAGLTFVETAGGTPRRPIHRYRFLPQDHDIRRGDEACNPDGSTIGTIEDLDLGARTVDIQHRGNWADARPEHIFVSRVVRPGDKPEALLALGRWIADHGVDAAGPHRTARDLILRRPPRLVAGSKGLTLDKREGMDDEVATACRLALELAHGVLPIQGPPGTGKTFTGSHMIVELVRAGMKVGVTAVSHEVIRNLLKSCIEVAKDQGFAGFRCLHKGKPKESSPEALHAVDDYKRIHALFDHGGCRVLGGTSWLWARDDFAESVDVLFIDEAGQMSLADVLAVARGAKSLVLLGDPRQLEQPQQASHPPGTQVSALEHILGGRKTIPDDAGLFLHQTRRLHPEICKFTAELFYENRLSAYPGLENQALLGAARFPEAGLVYLPVEHEGNQSRATEEVDVITDLVAELANGEVRWRDEKGAERPLTREDLMIVAPYNAQVTALAAPLPDVRIGTVDKFQGQQAPVVIVSLTTSSPDEAPRGMSFLYSANRLNVATSRAKGLCILIGNPKLFEPDCRTPEHMRLANAFCRYLELARVVRLS
ncbi:MAG: TM0106 family RecB-like putative nuclease [Gammaproteobacteria bacterium]|nr:TM0106 family RecB-like putative nuclease [Gammaproteobacteria bacterium]